MTTAQSKQSVNPINISDEFRNHATHGNGEEAVQTVAGIQPVVRLLFHLYASLNHFFRFFCCDGWNIIYSRRCEDSAEEERRDSWTQFASVAQSCWIFSGFGFLAQLAISNRISCVQSDPRWSKKDWNSRSFNVGETTTSVHEIAPLELELGTHESCTAHEQEEGFPRQQQRRKLNFHLQWQFYGKIFHVGSCLLQQLLNGSALIFLSAPIDFPVPSDLKMQIPLQGRRCIHSCFNFHRFIFPLDMILSLNKVSFN